MEHGRAHFTLIDTERPWLQTLGLTLLLGALAVASDLFAPTVFVTHSLVLGLVFYWIGLRVIGPMPALFVLALIIATLGFKWGQIHSGLLIVLEGLTVGWAWRRQHNPMLTDLLFWFVVGTPVSWFLYRYAHPIPHPGFEIALALQPVNGFIAVWIAYVVLDLLIQRPEPTRDARPSPDQSTKILLLKHYLIFGSFPLLGVVLLTAHKNEKNWISREEENLTRQVKYISDRISWRVADRMALVRELAAGQREETWPSSPDNLAGQLNAARRGGDIFLTMLAADKTGRVFASSPSLSQGRGALSVSDRAYFVVPMQTGRAFVSDVFLGRGFGSDMLVAISAPVNSRSEERLGIIEGSIRVDALAETIRTYVPDDAWRWVLSDGRLRVIATRGFDLAALAPLANSPLGETIKKASSVPSRYTDRASDTPTSYLSQSMPVPGTAWTLTLQRKWADVLTPIASVYGWALLIAIVTVLVAIAFVTWSVSDLLAAWHELVVFSAASEPHAGLLDRTLQRRLPLEFREFIIGLIDMSQRLESEKRARLQLLADLETRVEARTQDLRRALVKAEEADRAKSAFLATVSHELRTPLTSIITGVALLEAHLPAPPSVVTRTLTSLRKSSKALLGVIGGVLDYSKLEAGAVAIDARRFHPAATIADVVTVMEETARARGLIIRASQSYARDLEWTSDEARLRQVLLNLVGNAVKFTASGTVEISSWVSGGAAGAAQQLNFAVKDTGPGVPANRVATIFEPFVQLQENTHSGTGLGLAISHRLVRLMGGDISVRSTVGKGSEFRFWIS